jgi:hypothetical protein
VTTLVALIAGLLFGSGLLVSGMTNPSNVIAFLDIGGAWRPALAFTMAAAVGIALPACAVVRSRGTSLRGAVVALASRRRIDGSLLLGSAVFGVGWGLSGICPGPGLIVLASGDWRAFAFVGGLVLGMISTGAVRDGD